MKRADHDRILQWVAQHLTSTTPYTWEAHIPWDLEQSSSLQVRVPHPNGQIGHGLYVSQPMRPRHFPSRNGVEDEAERPAQIGTVLARATAMQEDLEAMIHTYEEHHDSPNVAGDVPRQGDAAISTGLASGTNPGVLDPEDGFPFRPAARPALLGRHPQPPAAG